MRRIGPVSAVVVVVMMGAAQVSPAFAAEPRNEPSVRELIAEATPGAEQAAVVPVAAGAGTEPYIAEAPAADTSATIPVDATEGISLEQDGGVVTVGLPNATQASPGVVDEDGLVQYDNQDGSTTVPLVRADGELQITTVIEDASAPQRYEYSVTSDRGRLIDAGDGAFAVVNAAGQPTAMITAAWAKDANGRDVPTRYEQLGDTLVQIVEHSNKYAYPIVADPAVRGNLITSVFLKWSSYGTTVSVTPRSGWAITPFSNWWAEYKLWVSAQYEGNKFYNQLRCHVDIAPFKSPWNLDAWRPDVSYSSVLARSCNP